MVENLCPQYKTQCRDPYMVIAEKAAGPTVRHIVSVCISITLLGVSCVVIVLLGSFFQNIFQSFHVNLSSCAWMVILTAVMCPVCLLGTPKDFWYRELSLALMILLLVCNSRFIAVGALTTTVIGCVMIIIKEGKSRPLLLVLGTDQQEN